MILIFQCIHYFVHHVFSLAIVDANDLAILLVSARGRVRTYGDVNKQTKQYESCFFSLLVLRFDTQIFICLVQRVGPTI